MFVEHPLIRPETMEDREYQAAIAKSCLKQSTLVVLPTGMGKTAIAIRVMAGVLKDRGGKMLLLAPTKPLVEQHTSSMRESLLVDKIAMFTGEATPPEERELLWRENTIICSTPQVIENDLRSGRIELDKVSLIVFDEAHRATGDYSYVDIAAVYKDRKGGLVMGTTASPGSSAEKILEVCENIGFKGVEIRTEYDADVVKYVQDIAVEPVRVDVPESGKPVAALLRKGLEECIADIKAHGFLKDLPIATRKNLLELSNEVHARIQGNEKNFHLYRTATAAALAMKIDHALELVETQGLEAVRNYFDRSDRAAAAQGSSKADKQFLRNKWVKEALSKAMSTEDEHVKIATIIRVVRDQLAKKADSRIIVFTHYRDTSEIITRELSKTAGVNPVRFVGQASKGEDRGLRQKEQAEIIERFSKGEHNVLVATSVAEEGLDIPATDLVVFYEPVPSEIRTIQRRGRTGRRRPGRVVVLVTRATRDEISYYSARRKERRMHEELERLRRELRQKIFVGEPSGEVFVRPVPEKVMENIRAEEREKAEGAQERRPDRKGQRKLTEF